MVFQLPLEILFVREAGSPQMVRAPTNGISKGNISGAPALTNVLFVNARPEGWLGQPPLHRVPICP